MNFIKDLIRGKLGGHPVHVMIVHFPLALFPVSLLFDILHYRSGDTTFSLMSFYCMVIGLCASFAAALFGTIDLMNIGKDEQIMKKALVHAGLNLMVVFSYTTIVALRYEQPGYVADSAELFIAGNIILNITMVAGAYFGGDLIFRHKVGVKD